MSKQLFLVLYTFFTADPLKLPIGIGLWPALKLINLQSDTCLTQTSLDVFVSKSDLKFPLIDSRNQNRLTGAIVFPALFLSYPCACDAAELRETKGLYEALTHEDLNDVDFLRDARLSLGGWVAAGANYNPDHPADHSNSPVSFNNRANEFNLEQLNLFVERQTIAGPDQWSVGGRFDFMFGLDAPYTQATGHWDQKLIGNNDLRYYKIALPQAYAEVYAPIANGITAKIGHFYSIIGYESVASPPNFFYSHSYSHKSSPFTHTGVLLSYPVQSDLTVYSGAVTGADNFDRQFGAWSYLGGFNWNSKDKAASFGVSALNGDVSETIDDNLTYISAVFQYQINERWRYVLLHDRGWQDNALGANTQTADWYSIVQYLTYAIDESLGVGLRTEWFRDQNGFRYSAGEAGYYAVTAGLNWRPLRWLTVRPEVRYDWADSASPAFNMGTKDNQFLAGADFVIQF
jgi:hypothetical protein